MNDGGGKRISISVAASIAAHAAIAVGVVLAPEVAPIPERVRSEAEFSIEIVPVDEPEVVPEPEAEIVPEPEPEPEPEVVPEPEPEPETRPPERDPRPQPVAAPAALAPSQPSVAIAPEPAPPQPEIAPPRTEDPPRGERDPRQRQQQWDTLINPEAVARSSFVVEGPGPSQPQRARPGVVGGTGTALRPRSEAEVEAELSEGLRAQAMTKSYTTRSTLRARPRPDGTFVYSGHAFTAVITADGDVQYEDRPGVQTEGFSASGSFDLGDMIMRGQGQDPYAAERQRFEDDNAELIARLEREAQARRMASGLRRLRGQLARIWQRDDQPAEQRRRLLFEQWAEVDETGGGGGAREVIEQFVRENLPVGSEHAFTNDELRRLNARLSGAVRFEPYR